MRCLVAAILLWLLALGTALCLIGGGVLAFFIFHAITG